MPRIASIILPITAIFAVLILLGCIGPLNPLSGGFYSRDINLGIAAVDQGDYISARKWFIQARAEADNNFLGKEDESCAVYNIARMNGMLGYYDIAERQLKEALTLEEKVYGTDGGHASMRWFELARLYYAWGRYPDSVAAYEHAFRLAENLDAEKSDPAAYAVCLRDFADALDRSGDAAQAKQKRDKAASISLEPPVTKILYYPNKL